MTEDDMDVGMELALQKELTWKHRIKPGSDAYEELKKSPHYTLAVKGDAAARSTLHELASEVAQRRREQRAGERRERHRKDLASKLIPEHERRREEVVAREYARLARRFGEVEYEIAGQPAREPSIVEAFRLRYLKGRPLTSKEAIEVLSSPAAAILQAEDFEPGRIPLLGHDSRIVRHKRRPDPKNTAVIREEFTISVSWGGKPKLREINYEWRDELPKIIVLRAGRQLRLPVYLGTLIDRLREAAEPLSKHYGWQLAEATWFVLTDQVPSVPCFQLLSFDDVSGFDHAHLRMKLSVLPWVSAETVARVYRSIQRDYLHYAQNRPTTIEMLELFDFVSERRNRRPAVSYREILKEWDRSRAKREERYGVNRVQSFQRDYERVRRQIILLGSARVRGKEPKRAVQTQQLDIKHR